MDTNIDQKPSTAVTSASESAQPAGAVLGLSSLSADVQVQDAMVEKGYSSAFDVANAPRGEFVAAMGEQLSEAAATQVYGEARAQTSFLHSVLTGIRADQANSGVMDTSAAGPAAPDQVDCDDCHAAVSPLAYLADLLDYVTKHVAKLVSSTLVAGAMEVAPQSGVGAVTGNDPAMTITCDKGSPFVGQANVTMQADDPSATIYYSQMTGTVLPPIPNNHSAKYTRPIPIDFTSAFRAVAYYANGSTTGVTGAVFHAKIATPTITPNGGQYTGLVDVALTNNSPHVIPLIRYTTNGIDPDGSSTLYNVPFQLQSSATVKARAFVGPTDPMDPSDVATSAAFTITPLSAPAFAPAPGVYFNPIDVTLAAAPGASIYYFIGDNPPTDLTQWAPYKKPLHLVSSSHISAYAKIDGTQSPQTTSYYTLKAATPVISPAGGSFFFPMVVALIPSASDVTVYYTLDQKTDPTTNSAVYSQPFFLESAKTVKAIAIQGRLDQSDVAHADFTLVPTQPLNLDDLTAAFHQPFGDLPISCEAVTAQVRQVRICVEVLRDYLQTLGPLPDLTGAEQAYCMTAYRTLLSQIGTSYDEIRLARSDDQTKRQALADRLGIELGTSPPDHLDALFVEPKDLTEAVLETLFGLQDTRRDPLSNGVKIGDNGKLVKHWLFHGVEWGRNTDPDGSVFMHVKVFGQPGQLQPDYYLELYSDRNLTQLQAGGQIWQGTTEISVGSAGYGLSGEFIIPAIQTILNGLPNMEFKVVPTSLCWQLAHLRTLWNAQDFPSGGGPAGTAPLIDPDLLEWGNFKNHRDTDPAYGLFLDRGKTVNDWLVNLKRTRESSSTPPSTPQAGLDAILHNVLNVASADLLGIDQKSGDFAATVSAMNLTMDGFYYLCRMCTLVKNNPVQNNDPLLAAEWDDIYSILTQVQKRQKFVDWRAEEEVAGLTLGPDYFTIAAADDVLAPPYGTGLAVDGSTLSDGAVDPTWYLTATPSGQQGPPYATNNAWPVGGPWLSNSPSSRWISPQANEATGDAPGVYVYRTTFNTTRFDPARVRIGMRVAVDNSLTDIKLNGQSLGLSAVGFGAFTDLSINGGFVVGANSLEFVVRNDGTTPNPSGLRVEFTATVVERNPWRVSQEAKQNWRATLQARNDQQQAVITARQEAIRATEQATLPALRDALIAASDALGTGLDARAGWITGKLLIDAQASGSQTTTRVAQAIETLQGLLWALRTGQLEAPLTNFVLLPDDTFDDEWQWIGSYATWRAAMLVFLYPENLLLPSLRRRQTPAFQKLVNNIRSVALLTPDKASQEAQAYFRYYEDVCTLSQVEASCHGLVDGQKHDLLYLFGRGGSTHQTYWSTYDSKDLSGYAQTFWDVVPALQTENVLQLIGAVPYDDTLSGKRYVVLFARTQSGGVQKLVFVKYDLDTQQWSGDSVSLPDIPENAVSFDGVVEVQNDPNNQYDRTKPPALMIQVASGAIYEGRLDSEASNLGATGWVLRPPPWGKWLPIGSPQSFSPFSRVTAVARTEKRLDLFIIGLDVVWWAWCDADVDQGSWTHGSGNNAVVWQQVPVSSTARFDAVVAAVAPTPDELHVFVLGSDTKIYSSVGNFPVGRLPTTGDWTPLGSLGDGSRLDSVSAIARLPNTIDIFGTTPLIVVGEDGVWWLKWPDGGWTPLLIGIVNPFVTPVARTPQEIELFATNPNGVFMAPYTEEHGWTAFGPLPAITVMPTVQGITPVAALARMSTRLDIFIVGSDHQVHHTWQDDDININWAPWETVGHLKVQASPLPVPLRYIITAVARPPDKDAGIPGMDLFVIDQNFEVQTTAWSQNNGDGSWGPWQRIADSDSGPHTFFSVSAVARNPGQIDLFAVDMTGRVWSSTWDASVSLPQGVAVEYPPVPVWPQHVVTFDITQRLTGDELQARRVQIEADFQHNLAGPASNLEYLREADYFVPMFLALQLQRQGYYKDALDWFRTVYDYSRPTDRKIYYGLTLEESLPPNDQRPDDWLLDPLNPHAIAATRPNTYTRYTLLSLVHCFLDYADAEFTRDTAESLPRARTLYMTALDLLDPSLLYPPPPTGQLPSTLNGAAKGEAQPLTLSALLKQAASQTAGAYAALLSQPAIAAVAQGMNIPTVPGFLGFGLTAALSSSFCIPRNPVLYALSLHAALELFKLRNDRNIAGMQREVEPYVAPTDTGTSMPAIGGSGQIVLPGTAVLKPTPYRYSTLIERAKQLVGLAQQIESAFLSVLEKLDIETYNLMKARQDVGLTRATVRLNDLMVTEAQGGVSLAQLQQQRAQIQADTYQTWLDAGLSTMEIAALALMVTSAALDVSAAIQANFSLSTLFNSGATGSSAAAQAASETATIFSTYAGYERRAAQWQLDQQVAQQDVQIGSQQIANAQDHVKVAGQQRTIAGMQADNAQAMVEFLANKFTNAELYDWMSGILERVYSYFLQEATAVAKVAENQLAFERQEIPSSFIQADYWQASTNGTTVTSTNGQSPDRRGLTGSARLLQDLYQLDQYAFDTNQRKLQLTKTISLARLVPFEFQQFRETGTLLFRTPIELFDPDFPGHYLRLIKRVRTSVVALIPPSQGIRATLATTGLSRVVIGGDVFQTIVLPQTPQSVALSSPMNATGLFELDTQPELLLPFENLGVDTSWEFQMPKAANPFDYDTIADVLITIEYTALNDYDYGRQVIQRLDNKVSADRAYSFRQQFADAWYDLNNPAQSATPMSVQFSTVREDFPSNIDDLSIAQVVLYFARADAQRFNSALRVTLDFTSEGTTATAHPRTLSGHTSDVNSVAFSPDGKTVLTGSNDKTARLWETASGALLRTLSGHTDIVFRVAFSPDGRTVLTGSNDNTARLWDAGSGQLLHILSGHTNFLFSVAFSPDGKTVLTGSGDYTARLWDTDDGKLLRTLSGHTNAVDSAAFSPDGNTVLTGSMDNTARLWKTASDAPPLTLSGHTGFVFSVAFSPDGKTVLTGSADNTARLWETASGKLLYTLSGHTSAVNSVAFSPDGRTVLTGSGDYTARLWETGSGKLLRTLSGHTGVVDSVAFSPDGRTVLTGSYDNTARLWDTDNGKLLYTLSGPTARVTSVAFSPDGKTVLTGSVDNTARLWGGATGGYASSTTGVFSTRTGTAPNWIALIGDKPVGAWTLTLPNDQATQDYFKNELIEDILLVITFAGQTPPWPV